MPTTQSRGTCGNCEGTPCRSHGPGGNGWNGEHAPSGSSGATSARSSQPIHSPPSRSFTGTPPERSSPARNRMREICTSGSVGGEGGNILAYPAANLSSHSDPEVRVCFTGDPGFRYAHPGYDP